MAAAAGWRACAGRFSLHLSADAVGTPIDAHEVEIYTLGFGRTKASDAIAIAVTTVTARE